MSAPRLGTGSSPFEIFSVSADRVGLEMGAGSVALAGRPSASGFSGSGRGTESPPSLQCSLAWRILLERCPHVWLACRTALSMATFASQFLQSWTTSEMRTLKYELDQAKFKKAVRGVPIIAHCWYVWLESHISQLCCRNQATRQFDCVERNRAICVFIFLCSHLIGQ